jgi:hypothetical protein
MFDRFLHVIKIDFEFCYPGCTTAKEAEICGENPIPVCMVARDLHTGQTWKLWQGEFGPLPPFPHGDDTLIVAYMAAAELSCYLALGWPLPKYVLDLYVEFRRHTNGYNLPAGAGQIGALIYFGLDAIDVAEKEEMRALILTGGPWSAAERAAILDYNESDVIALYKLLPAMLPHIDMPRALLRGRYMVVVALMESYGIPIDVELLNELRRWWKDIRLDLIAEVDAAYGVYDGDRVVNKRWEAWLIQKISRGRATHPHSITRTAH